jgi:Ulp1 family protease
MRKFYISRPLYNANLHNSSTLSPGQWLVDEVVNMYMTLLQKRDVS